MKLVCAAAIAVAAAAGRVTGTAGSDASSFLREVESFGPMKRVATASLAVVRAPRRRARAVGDNSTTAPATTPGNATTAPPTAPATTTNTSTGTSTTSSTTSTTLRPATYVHFAFYENQAGLRSPANKSAQRDNIECSLSDKADAAYFAILKDTNCSCQPMPGQFTSDGAERYYQLSLDEQSDDSLIRTLRAFCTSGCDAGSCRVERGPVVDPNATSPVTCNQVDFLPEPVEYDQCQPTAGDTTDAENHFRGSGSWTVRQPAVTRENDFDVCVLRDTSALEPPAEALVTTLYMPPGNCNASAGGWDEQEDAVWAYTAAVTGGCDDNLPGFAQQLTINGSSIAGLVDCECSLAAGIQCSCEREICATAPSKFDQCAASTDSSESSVALVRTADIGTPDAKFLYLCKHEESTRPPRSTLPPGPHGTTHGPTDAPSNEKSKGSNTTVIAAAAGGAVFVVLVLVLGVVLAKKRKAKRMAAYSALQDDPTF